MPCSGEGRDQLPQIPPCSSTGTKAASKQLKNWELWFFGTRAALGGIPWGMIPSGSRGTLGHHSKSLQEESSSHSSSHPHSGDKAEITIRKGNLRMAPPQKKMGLGSPRLLPGPKSALGSFFGVPEKWVGGEAASWEESPCPGVLGKLLEALGSHSGSSGALAEPPRWGLATAPSQGKTFCEQFPNRSLDWMHKSQRNSLAPNSPGVGSQGRNPGINS